MSDATTALAAAQSAAASASTAGEAATGAAESVVTALAHRSAAQAAAQTAADDAVAAVGPVNDTVMTSVDGNAGSAFRVQSDARLAATYAGKNIERVAQHIPPGTLRGTTVITEDTSHPRVIENFGGYYWGATTDNKLWKSTDGTTWTLVATGIYPLRLLPCADGEVLQVRGADIQKSTGWATNPATATWTTVLTRQAGSVNNGFPVFGFDSDETGQRFIASEYGPDYAYANRVYMSLDAGATWTTKYDSAVTWPSDYTNTHVHGCCYDKYEDRWWFSEGHANARGLYYSDNDGTTWTKLTADSINPDGQPVGMFAVPDGLICGSDAPDGMVMVVRRTADPTLQRLEVIAKWPEFNVAFQGFPNRGYLDAATGIVYFAYCNTADSTTPLRIVATDGTTVRNLYANYTGTVENFKQIVVHDGHVFAMFTQGGANKLLTATAGPPSPRQYVDNDGNIKGGVSSHGSSLAIGQGVSISASDTVVVGAAAVITGASPTGVTAVGRRASAGNAGTAVGKSATAGDTSTVVGNGATASSTDSVTVGKGASATGPNSVVVGSLASSTQTNSVVIGKSIAATNQGVTAIGGGAAVTGDNATAVGRLASAGATNATAIGVSANASGAGAVALGRNTVAPGSSSVIAGDGATGTSSSGTVAIGQAASVSAADAVALGHSATCGWDHSVALGAQTTATASYQVMMGPRHIALTELAADPAAAAADGARLYLKDNGSGKTQLAARFNTGAVQILASESGARPLPAFTTAGRPAASAVEVGSVIYDTTLSKPTWSDGTNWKDAAGTTV